MHLNDAQVLIFLSYVPYFYTCSPNNFERTKWVAIFTYLQTVLLLDSCIMSAMFLNNIWLMSMYHLTSKYFDLQLEHLLSCKILVRLVPSTTYWSKESFSIFMDSEAFTTLSINQLQWYSLMFTWKRSFFSKIGYLDLPNDNGQAILSTASLVNSNESRVSWKLNMISF